MPSTSSVTRFIRCHTPIAVVGNGKTIAPLSAGVCLAERFADDGAISAFPDVLARRFVFRSRADGDAARLVAWHRRH